MAVDIITVGGKGAPLNAAEFDANLTNLKTAVDENESALAGKLGKTEQAADSAKLGGKTLTQILPPYSNPLESYASTDPIKALSGGLLYGNLTGTSKWIGGVLAPNGKIYGIPRNATQILEFDPVTQTTNLTKLCTK